MSRPQQLVVDNKTINYNMVWNGPCEGDVNLSPESAGIAQEINEQPNNLNDHPHSTHFP